MGADSSADDFIELSDTGSVSSPKRSARSKSLNESDLGGVELGENSQARNNNEAASNAVKTDADESDPDRLSGQNRYSPNDGLTILSYLIAGLLLYGAIGWALDRWLHTVWFMPFGLIFGMVVSIYLVIKKHG